MAAADIIQIGARNMQNFELLKKIGRLGKAGQASLRSPRPSPRQPAPPVAQGLKDGSGCRSQMPTQTSTRACLQSGSQPGPFGRVSL